VCEKVKLYEISIATLFGYQFFFFFGPPMCIEGFIIIKCAKLVVYTLATHENGGGERERERERGTHKMGQMLVM